MRAGLKCYNYTFLENIRVVCFSVVGVADTKFLCHKVHLKLITYYYEIPGCLCIHDWLILWQCAAARMLKIMFSCILAM
jgi:hypothetical protein